MKEARECLEAMEAKLVEALKEIKEVDCFPGHLTESIDEIFEIVDQALKEVEDE